ncbi:hypothetical protein [Oceanobacillus kimchii]|nr:hypothetical protein [Oceanobacillus kimchii]
MEKTKKARKRNRRKPRRNHRATYSISSLLSHETKEELFKLKGEM